MLHAYDQRFDVTGNFENFCELNKASGRKGKKKRKKKRRGGTAAHCAPKAARTPPRKCGWQRAAGSGKRRGAAG